MPPNITDEENNEIALQSVEYASSQATSDADFLKILRATYFARHPQLNQQGAGLVLRGRTNARSLPTLQPPSPSAHIFDDPRFLANARALAQRASQKLRIIVGTNVAAKAFPDCVALGNDSQWACTGTLIAPSVVISAGHCADFATRVFIGNDVNAKGTIVGVAKKIRHPKYHDPKSNDLLILVLDKAAKVTPRRFADGADIDAATDGRAVGFGNVDATGQFGYGTKRQVDVPIASTHCTGKVLKRTDAATYGCDRDLEMVAGKPLLGKDSCSGDSGGPFYISDGKKGWLLAGATSRSTKSAMSTCGDGGIYVRVDRYREWIEDTAKVKLK